MGGRSAHLRRHRCARGGVITSAVIGSITTEVCRSIRAIDREEWNACFAGDPEDWACHCAIEEAGLAAFSWVYFAAREQGRLVAVVPGFVTEYNLATTIQGAWKTALQPLARMLHRLLTLRLACLGSPLTDTCKLGFAPGLAAERRAEVTGRLLKALERFAVAEAIGLLAAKDLSDASLAHGVGEAFAQAGYSRQPGLPNAVLTLSFPREEDYLASLSQGMRREIRRKLRRASDVHVQILRGTQALDQCRTVLRLYDRQRSRSSVDFDQFETLTERYFQNMIAMEGATALVFLYTHEGKLLAFNLCYHTEQVFIDKYIGFDEPRDRRLDLYILSWMTNVRYCMRQRIACLQSGQTGYAMKRRLGSVLEPTWILFRHRNSVLNRALRLAGPLLAPDRYDETITPPRALP